MTDEKICHFDETLDPLVYGREVVDALEREGSLVIAGSDTTLLIEHAKHSIDAISVLLAPIFEMFRQLAVQAWSRQLSNQAQPVSAKICASNRRRTFSAPLSIRALISVGSVAPDCSTASIVSMASMSSGWMRVPIPRFIAARAGLSRPKLRAVLTK